MLRNGAFLFSVAVGLLACSSNSGSSGGGDGDGDSPFGALSGCKAGTYERALDEMESICAPCAPGEYCPGDEAGPEPCVDETFDDDLDPATKCQPKTTCQAGTRVESDGSATSDRTCEVCQGSFNTETNASTCTDHADCAPGQYVSEDGTPTTDRMCAPCAAGSFSEDENESSCKTWLTCIAGEFVETKGTSTNAARCEPCSPGTFSTEENAASCEEWTECGSNGLEDAPGSSTSDHTCRPGWAIQWGTVFRDKLQDITLDPTTSGDEADFFVVGTTEGQLPDQTQAGGQDWVALKLDGTTREPLWTKQWGTAQYDFMGAAVATADGDLIVFGHFYNGSTTKDELYLARLAGEDGAIEWEESFGSESGSQAYDVALDASGNIILVARIAGNLYGETNPGGFDTLVEKRSAANGAIIWSSVFGTASGEEPAGLALDSSGNVYVGGECYNALGGLGADGPYSDGFLVKFDGSTGAELWNYQLSTDGVEEVGTVAVDASDNAYLAGLTSGQFPTTTALGEDDLYVAKFSSSGTLAWVTQHATSSDDDVFDLLALPSGKIALVGGTRGEADGEGNQGQWDFFVRTLDATTGATSETEQLGTDTFDEMHGAEVQPDGSIYLAGYSEGEFVPGVREGDQDFLVVVLDEL